MNTYYKANFFPLLFLALAILSAITANVFTGATLAAMTDPQMTYTSKNNQSDVDVSRSLENCKLSSNGQYFICIFDDLVPKYVFSKSELSKNNITSLDIAECTIYNDGIMYENTSCGDYRITSSDSNIIIASELEQPIGKTTIHANTSQTTKPIHIENAYGFDNKIPAKSYLWGNLSHPELKTHIQKNKYNNFKYKNGKIVATPTIKSESAKLDFSRYIPNSFSLYTTIEQTQDNDKIQIGITINSLTKIIIGENRKNTLTLITVNESGTQIKNQYPIPHAINNPIQLTIKKDNRDIFVAINGSQVVHQANALASRRWSTVSFEVFNKKSGQSPVEIQSLMIVGRQDAI